MRVNLTQISVSGFGCAFDAEVTVAVQLTNEDGADLHCIRTVVGGTTTLTPVAGQELANETAYKIEVDVRDSSDNR